MEAIDLKNPSLLKTKCYVNGQWVKGTSDNRVSVLNPLDHSLVATVPDFGQDEVRAAIEAANNALPSWRSKTAGERAIILRRWFDLMIENKEDLGKILTVEQGKPLKEAIGEIVYGASFVEWFAEEAKRTYGDVIPGHQADKRIVVVKQPIGVVAAITPWNFPNAMITRKAAPALAAGCTMVLKPAKSTPLSALAIAELGEQAGIPPGVFNVITSNRTGEVGKELTSNPIVKKMSFTGSTEVGKRLIRDCAENVTKVSMELGGNAPFIIFDDADIEAAVEGAIVSKFRNAGQTCVCTNRIFAQEGIYDAFVEKLSKEVAKLKMGDGLDDETVIGPLIDDSAIDFVKGLVKDATEKGAKVTAGGTINAECESIYEPTVLANASKEMDVYKEEIFGPIAPVFKFKSEEEVIELANDTPYGLASYFYSNNYALIWRVAEALDYGMVGINTGLISTTVAPFGGVKQSGFGREGSKYGIDEYMETKYMCIGGI